MMDVSKGKSHTYASKLSKLISKPKTVFAEHYRGYDEKKREKVYLQVLHEVHQAVSLGNAEVLEKCGDLIDLIQGVEGGEKIKYYDGIIDNPFRETNAIILACKGGSAEIIECLFANGGKLLKNISGNNGSTLPMLPSATKGDCHNCIYYAIRSNSVKLLDTLVKKWPDDYFVNHPEDLDDVISKSYKELMMKNVPISTEMKLFVEYMLIDVRFFFDYSKKSDHVKRTQETIASRIDLVLKYIKILKERCTKEEKVDAWFLSVMKFIASNIHILKSQLKSTYGRIPWEEMEFCLVCYVLSLTTKKYINLYFHVVLKREKLLRYLQRFSECLEKEMSNIKNSDVNNLRKTVDLKRKNVVADISSEHPLFVEMYDDYEQIRDVYSLVKMRKYIDLAVTADCTEKEGQLVVMRALQVIGEHLKNTLESPKLSDVTSELLLLTVASFTRETLTSLRNSLSHADALSKRAEIGGEILRSIQDDVKKIGAEIGIVLRKRETNIIRKVLEKFVGCDGFEEAKQFKDVCQCIGSDKLYLSGLERTKFDLIEEIIENLSDTIGDKTIYEKELFKGINELIIYEKKRSEDAIASTKMGYATIESISVKLNNYSLNFRTLRTLKLQAKEALENITPNPQLMVDSKLDLLIGDIYSSAKLRMKGNKLIAICELSVKCSNIFTFKTDNAKWIERFDEIISVNKSKKSTVNLMNKEKYVSLLKEDFLLLQNILKRYDICTHSAVKIASNIRNTKLQAVLEMLLLDIMSILDILKESRDHNYIFLDDDLPLLMGRFLRNHLAHGNVLMDVLCSDPAIALVSNALKINSENVIGKTEKIGKLVKEDTSLLENRMNHDVDVIFNQERMFSALEEGNYEELMTCLKKGADIWARNHNKWTSLHFAAKGSSLQIVKYVLDQNLNVNAKDINGQCPLHVAANFGRTSIAEFIIQERSVDFNERDSCFKTPLDVAAENGHKDIVELLLKHTSKTYYTGEMMFVYDSPVYHAVKNNQFDVAALLLEREKNVDATHCKGGYTLLYTAAEEGFLQLVKYLLERKACPNSRCDKQGTPLHSASLYGHLEVVKSLVMYGGDINAKCMNGLTPLHNAVEYGHEEIAKFLLEHGADVNIAGKCYRNTPLHLAALYGHTGIIEILLLYKANVNSEKAGGSTPVHLAAMNGHSTIVDILIKHRAPVNASNSHGQTAMHLSCFNKHQNTASLLLKHGAQLNDKDEEGRCSLHMACLGGCRRVVEVLISGGAEINAKDINGQTPLHLSTLNANKEVLDILLRKGVFIDSTDKMGFTPLHLAVFEKNDGTVVEYLISKGADVNVENLIGRTPLHTASLLGDMKVIVALLEAGADVNLEDQRHYTPLRLSVTGNHKEIVEYLISKGANVNCGIKSGSTPLCEAVSCNNHDIAKILVSKGADVNVGKPLNMAVLAGSKRIVYMLLKKESIDVSVSPGDFTLLHCAAVRGRANIVEALLRKGVYVDPIGRANATPLHHAVYEGDEKITEILLKNGANVNHESTEGTVLHSAAPKGYTEVVEVLLRYGADVNIVDLKNRTPLQLAVAYNCVKVVQVLICHKKTNIQVRDKNDWNLLHIAASKGHLDMVKLLFEHKVDARSKNDHGSKPIHLAARDGHTNIVDFFLNNGIDINDRGCLGSTLLHYAAQGDTVEVARFLIGKGYDVNAVDGNRRTPLHTATSIGNVKIIIYLLSQGARYNAKDNFRKRPSDLAFSPEASKLLTSTENLFVAVKGNNSSGVENCVKEGAFIDAKSNKDATVLHQAAWKGYENVANVLLKSKANPNVLGKNGLTPLHYAAKFGHFEIVMALLSNGATYNSASITCKTPLDFADDKDIVNLLELIDTAFKEVENGNSNIIKDLKRVKDAERVKAFMNCCNGDGRSLVVHAVRNNFPKTKELKQMLMEEFSGQIREGKEMFNAEHYEESRRIFEDVLQKMKFAYGSNNPTTLEIKEQLTLSQYRLNDFKGALSGRQEIYERQKTLLGTKCRDTLSTRSNIALILHRQGKDDEALDIFEEVYSSQKELLGESDPDTMDTQYHMALSLFSVGRCEEAFENNMQYYEKSKAKLGDDDPQTIVAQNNLAMVLSGLGKFEEALQTYQDVLRRKSRVFGSSHFTTLRTMHSIASVNFDQGRLDECLEAWQEVYKRQKKKMGKFHLDTLHTQFTIGNVLFSQGKFLEALKAYKEGFDRRKEMLGPDHPNIIITEIKMDFLNFNLQIQGVNESDSLRFMQNAVCDNVNTEPQ